MGKRKTLILTTAGYLLLTLMIVLVGCSQPAPSTAPAPPPASKPATTSAAPPPPSTTAKPATITLTGVTYQAVTSSISVPMTMLKEKLAANSNGQIVLNIKGGPEAIGAFDQPEAVRKGVVDLALSIATYTQSLEPGAAMAAYIGVSPMDVRKNGLLEILEQVYNRINLKFLGMAQWPADRLLNSTRLMKEPEELKGLSVRSSGGQEELTLKFFGATPNALPWGDAYTALQTGVIQGYFGSTASTAEMKLYEVTKYAYNHSTQFGGSVIMIMNLDSFKKLPANLQTVLVNSMIQVEIDNAARYEKLNATARAQNEKGGMQYITFSAEGGKRYLKTAFDFAWNDLFKAAPHVPQKARELAGT